MSAKTKAGQPYDREWRLLPDTRDVGWVVTEERLLAPLKWRCKPRTRVRITGDLFGEGISDRFIDHVLAVIALCPHIDFHVLTKRSARMREYMSDIDAFGRVINAMCEIRGENIDGLPRWPLPNLHLYVSVEDQPTADGRIPDLLATPAAVRGVSLEPMLGTVDLSMLHHDNITNINALTGHHGVAYPMQGRGPKLNHVICGGESGVGARPMHPDWVRGLRDQCVAAGVPFFFKQWGEWAPRLSGGQTYCNVLETGMPDVAWPDGTIAAGTSVEHGGLGMSIDRVGKKRAGRVLDGVTWDGMPGDACPK